jgi:cell division protein FtsZ
MVRPGLINLDFADVETVMSSMGKAMMGTGEAEGDNRAIAATEMALNNPLIDEYSLQGAKGLLINITGGKDLTLFEVDQTVQKIRAEVDPEAEIIFGAIKDENMNGKMRVSIVATALDGHKPESKTVLNMVDRIQNRNNGYSEGLFSKSTHIENNTFNSISGTNALKLDEQFEVKERVENNINSEAQIERSQITETIAEDSVVGISMDNATYVENSIITESKNEILGEQNSNGTINEEYTPQLFSDGNDQLEQNSPDDTVEAYSKKLLDQDERKDEDFEIPAFLRRQKF